MPAKNSRKIFIKDKVYHLYNRGVEGRKIFLDDQDYRTFLHFFKLYLTNPAILQAQLPSRPVKQNFYELVDLLSFCLLPNHFHLLIRLNQKEAMSKFMHQLSGNFSSYFNRRYKRNGTLYQGIYRAVQVDTSLEIVTVSRYINLNPIIEKVDNDYKIVKGKRLEEAVNFPYSSLPYVLGKKSADWLKTDFILKNLKLCPRYKNYSYLEFLKTSESGGGTFVDD